MRDGIGDPDIHAEGLDLDTRDSEGVGCILSSCPMSEGVCVTEKRVVRKGG